jgi:uncharacterized membrane protein required for colicin V production
MTNCQRTSFLVGRLASDSHRKKNAPDRHGKESAILALMMHLAVLPPVVANAKFDYFDIVAIVWLIIGLLRGRKRGMSQELLPTFQWLGILAAGGLLYGSFGPWIKHNTYFSVLWSNIAAYVLIAAGVHLIYVCLKRLLAARLGEKDLFGRGEFYLGAIAGGVRFTCILLVLMALMNSRVATDEELAKTKKFQKDNFSDVSFPTYGEFQHDVLFRSFSGNWVHSNLNSVLIATVKPELLTKPEPVLGKSTNMIASAASQPAKK